MFHVALPYLALSSPIYPSVLGCAPCVIAGGSPSEVAAPSTVALARTARLGLISLPTIDPFIAGRQHVLVLRDPAIDTANASGPIATLRKNDFPRDKAPSSRSKIALSPSPSLALQPHAVRLPGRRQMLTTRTRWARP